MEPAQLTTAHHVAVYVAPRRGERRTGAERAAATAQLEACASAARQSAGRRGLVVVSVPPDIAANANGLAGVILEELGKDLDLQRGRLATDEAWMLTGIWLRAHEIGALLVIGVEHAGVALWHRLTDLAAHARLTVVLLSETLALSRGQRALFASPHGSIKSWEPDAFTAWLTQLSAASRHAPGSVPRPSSAARFPGVPSDEIPFFRDTCRRLLSAGEFAVVDATYLDAFAIAERWLEGACRPLSEKATGAFLAGLIADARGIHEQLARLRGAQAAFWRARWLLKVRPDALVAAYRLRPDGIDREAASAVLNGYVSPRTAALAAIALRTGLSPGRLSLLNADQLSHGCRTINLGDDAPVSLGPERPLLIAHELHRERQGRDPRGPLFCRNDGERLRPRAIQQILRRSATETGLALTQTWSAPPEREHTFWMHRRGLTIQPLPTHAR
jgi:hypothetical protein